MRAIANSSASAGVHACGPQAISWLSTVRCAMTRDRATQLPGAFRRLAWSNLAAQSAEQIGLAAAPLVAVLMLGAGAGEAGLLQMAQTLPFLLLALPAGVL